MIIVDNLCLTCDNTIRGTCCNWIMKIGNVYSRITHMKCPFLSIEGWCSVYENRFKYNPYCLTLQQMKAQNLFVEGCKYAKT